MAEQQMLVSNAAKANALEALAPTALAQLECTDKFSMRATELDEKLKCVRQSASDELRQRSFELTRAQGELDASRMGVQACRIARDAPGLHPPLQSLGASSKAL